jgi:hypothetical protein
MKFSDKREKLKITLMGILLAYACLLTYYFHAIRKTGSFFTHFFYIPIIISSLWWKKKGLVVAVFLATFLIASDYVFRVKMLTADDYPRAAMFIIISFVVALLS